MFSCSVDVRLQCLCWATVFMIGYSFYVRLQCLCWATVLIFGYSVYARLQCWYHATVKIRLSWYFKFSFMFPVSMCLNHHIYTLHFPSNLIGDKSLETGRVTFYRSSGNCNVDWALCTERTWLLCTILSPCLSSLGTALNHILLAYTTRNKSAYI